MNEIPYYHVDVFSAIPFSGNGLIVFTEAESFSAATMQTLTQEMRQFESIFLQEIRDNTIKARIFTCSEELDFAGHPVLGAAAVLHDQKYPDHKRTTWTFQLNAKTVTVTTERSASTYDAAMDQGKAEFGRTLDAAETRSILDYLNATPQDLYPGLPVTVVSTGLPYLIIPFKNNQFKANIGAPGLEEKLHHFGAKFIGLLDIETRSIRTGDNDGSVEDIATGSLAGPAGAYLVKHGLEKADQLIQLQQGKNLSRNSRLYVQLKTCSDNTHNVFVSGSVCKIARGLLEPFDDRSDPS
ncbi:PhzF family phenazine biosynthesis protein [Puia sp.]|jgi:PhzF family phenazine biosynthesis protein|uniref:PhzF family phenazine biosynthesis protein n=1 Tax=Puia sp. TaxID=2045100 RepID=UPI002F3F4396